MGSASMACSVMTMHGPKRRSLYCLRLHVSLSLGWCAARDNEPVSRWYPRWCPEDVSCRRRMRVVCVLCYACFRCSIVCKFITRLGRRWYWTVCRHDIFDQIRLNAMRAEKSASVVILLQGPSVREQSRRSNRIRSPAASTVPFCNRDIVYITTGM
jgi:hypothetical protein